MKHTRFVATLGLATITLSACGGSGDSSASTDGATGAADSGSITLSAYSGIFQDNYQKAVIDPFIKKFPKIDVKYNPVKSSADNLAGLRAGQGNPTSDVSIMDVSVSDTANKSDLFEKLDPEQVPNAADVDDKGKNPDGFGPAVTFDSLVLAYNEKVSPAPTKWADMWDSKYKGKVVVTAHPDIQGTSLMMIMNKQAGGDYTKDVSPGVEKLKELAPSVQTFAPQPDVYTLVQSGTADIGIAWNARAQYYSDQSSGKQKVAIPDDDTIFQINTINLVKGSKNSKAAQTFINYALSPEAQKTFTETMFYAPTNTKAEPSSEALARTAADPSKVEQVMDIDWAYVATQREKWTQLWRREIIRGS